MALPAGRRGVRPDQIKPDGSLNISEPVPYELPVAGANTLGGIKVGSGLSITEGGVLSAATEPYTLPVADGDTLGGVKVGSGLSITEGGVLSATAQIPAYTSSDEGKVLSVNSSGELEWITLTPSL